MGRSAKKRPACPMRLSAIFAESQWGHFMTSLPGITTVKQSSEGRVPSGATQTQEEWIIREKPIRGNASPSALPSYILANSQIANQSRQTRERGCWHRYRIPRYSVCIRPTSRGGRCQKLLFNYRGVGSADITKAVSGPGWAFCSLPKRINLEGRHELWRKRSTIRAITITMQRPNTKRRRIITTKRPITMTMAVMTKPKSTLWQPTSTAKRPTSTPRPRISIPKSKRDRPQKVGESGAIAVFHPRFRKDWKLCRSVKNGY